ncbi:MAG: hypothetical protein ACQEP1_05245 [Nanobdellota archaeon]
MAIKSQGSIKRYGARYGRTVRTNAAHIESKQRKVYKCPYCRKISARREAVGIWKCSKCENKFTGRAYELVPEKVSKVDKSGGDAPIESIEKDKEDSERYKAESEIKREPEDFGMEEPEEEDSDEKSE